MKRISFFAFLLFLSLAAFGAERTVTESARQIPIAYDVDVVVAGGTSAGVAAAVEAARNGAKVFLAAPRTYLGEELCGTYRLWLEPGEKPESELAQKIFAEPPAGSGAIGKGLPFSYSADISSSGVHKDTPTPSRLSDGQWKSASNQSVQYDGNANIIVDLGESKSFQRIHLLVFQRNGDFAVEKTAVSISGDRQHWKQIVIIKNDALGQAEAEEDALDLSSEVDAKARYVKFSIKKGIGAKRILLGEIVIEAEAPPKESSAHIRIPPTPQQVKLTLDRALLDAGVPFLYSCFVTDVLRDGEGKPAGVVIVNRNGRQAVKAKVVIDAMPRANVARMAGADFAPYPAGSQTFQRIVIGGEMKSEGGMTARKLPSPIRTGAKNEEYGAFEYTLTLPMEDASFASFAAADQAARDKTFDAAQMDASEVLFQIPPDPMKGKKSLAGDWPGAAKADLDAFRPANQKRIFVLSGCADISRQAAEKLLRPLAYLEMGTRIGWAAAEEAKNIPSLQGVHLPGEKANSDIKGEVKEILSGLRPTEEGAPTIPAAERALPILGEYDVAVIGGGTGGAPAGISAARQGVKTLVAEYLYGLGGIGTIGLIGRYYIGFRDGFTAEVDKGVAEMGSDSDRRINGWNVELKMEWLRRELRKAGADIWFGVLGCGAFIENGCVKGAIVATPEGRGVILAKTSIDATGSSDIAIAAGADYMFTTADNAALQGTGLPPRQLGANYTNTDYTFTDDADPVDVWRSFVTAREKFQDAYDLSQIVDSRERRRIVGDFVISPLDIFNHRTYPDSVVLSRSNFDSHGYTVHPCFMLKPPDKETVLAYTPYRSLLPKGLDGIIVTGLGISAHRDAMPILRMQPCIQNQGYAMGIAASMAAKEGKGTRAIDIKALQKILVEKGNLPENVLTDADSYPFPQERIAQAVKDAANDYQGIGIILAQPDDALPLLRQAYESFGAVETKAAVEEKMPPALSRTLDPAEAKKAKLIYTHILGVMGDPTGSADLVEAVKEKEWDKGWSFTGMGQFGGSLSPVDSLIVALGNTHDKRGLQPILDKAKQLEPSSEFSHFRAVSMALETLGDPAAAKVLTDLLKKPNMTGNAITDISQAIHIDAATHGTDNTIRDRTLRELILARALYRCGDVDGLGEKILREYEKDLRGHFARHAHAVLKKNDE